MMHLIQCNVTFHGNTTFLQNKGRYGGVIYANSAVINILGHVEFLENEAEYGGALILYQSNVSVLTGQSAEVNFVGNRAQEFGGAVYAIDSQIIIRSGQKLSFVENKGYDGGAITLTGDSIIFLEANSSIIFVRNHAYHSGGAIYNVDNYKEDFKLAPKMSKCFFGFLKMFKYNYLRSLCNAIQRKHISIQFCNNTAEFAGTAIYGGWLDLCQLHVNYQVMSKNQDGIYQAAV